MDIWNLIGETLVEDFLPDLQKFLRLARKHSIIPVSAKIDVEEDPIFALSSMDDPIFAFERDGTSIFGQAGGVMAFERGQEESPFDFLSTLLSGGIAPPASMPFSGGVVGYLGYDAARPMLGMECKEPDPVSLPHALFLSVNRFYQARSGTLRAVYCTPVDDEPIRVYRRATEEVEAMLTLPKPRRLKEPRFSDVSVNVEKAEYLKMVNEAKSRISKGEIKQAIISRRISVKADDPLAVYLRLRKINPCPYLFFLRAGDRAVLGSSPENFLTLRGSFAESRPVAATRRRGTSPAEDKRLEQELRSSRKERAEHAMLLDECLAEFKSVCREVRVEEKLKVKKFPFFQHLVSRISGRTTDKFSLLKVSFPSATIAGAPKRKAMEVIDEIEPDARGVYAGSFGFVDNSGNLDMGIIVRSILINGGRAFVPVGAGIVSQSLPEAEYSETFYKSRAQLLALGADRTEMKWLAEI